MYVTVQCSAVYSWLLCQKLYMYNIYVWSVKLQNYQIQDTQQMSFVQKLRFHCNPMYSESKVISSWFLEATSAKSVTFFYSFPRTGKLLSRSMKLAYALLNKVGSHKEGTSIMTGDRVSHYPLNPEIKFEFSFVAPIHFLQIEVVNSGEKLVKSKADSSCVIMSIILIINLFDTLLSIDITRKILILVTLRG